MGNRVQLWVPGSPRAKGRPRVTLRGRFPVAYTPRATREWEDVVRKTALTRAPKQPLSCPVVCHLDFTFRSPRKVIGQALPRADVDNLAKAVLDALNGIIFADDSLIQELLVTKGYGPLSGVRIVVTPVEEVDRHVVD